MVEEDTLMSSRGLQPGLVLVVGGGRCDRARAVEALGLQAAITDGKPTYLLPGSRPGHDRVAPYANIRLAIRYAGAIDGIGGWSRLYGALRLFGSVPVYLEAPLEVALKSADRTPSGMVVGAPDGHSSFSDLAMLPRVRELASRRRLTLIFPIDDYIGKGTTFIAGEALKYHVDSAPAALARPLRRLLYPPPHDAASLRWEPEDDYPADPGVDEDGALIGYRIWSLVRSRTGESELGAATRIGFSWPRSVTTADCPRCRTSPATDCACGLYAHVDPSAAVDDWLRALPQAALGRVRGWGRVQVHRSGWRAQQVQILELAVVGRDADAVAELEARYECPVVSIEKP